MKKRLFALNLTLAFAIITLFTTCKKEIKVSDFAGIDNSIKVYDLNGDFPLAQIKRPGGGFFLVYGENVNSQKDVSVAVTDDEGNVIQKTTFGGNREDRVTWSGVDARGNLYVVGHTASAELRMDKNAKTSTNPDGYVAKLDKDGNLLWQRGYSDTATKFKGIRHDIFLSACIIGNKIYCVGGTGNRFTPTPNGSSELDTWLVIFDENGNVLKDRTLPSIYRGKSLTNFGGSISIEVMKLSDNDLIVRNVFMAYLSQGRNMDTTAVLCRYSIDQDSVLWAKYFRQSSPQGDICYGGMLANGHLAFLDTYWNIINLFDVNSGDVIKTTTVGNNTPDPGSDQYRMHIGFSPFMMDDELYFLGFKSKGASVANQKPFVTKLDREGNLAFHKVFEIPQGAFYWVNETREKNLQFMGGINVYKTNNIKLFTLTTDKNGNVINQ